MEPGKLKRKKRSQWHKHQVLLLLDLWEEKLPQLRGLKRNSHIYADMAVEMATRGFVFSEDEIKVKIHNLTSKYRDEKNIVGPSGGTTSAWEHYKKVHYILGGYKSFNLEAMVEESAAASPSAERSMLEERTSEPPKKRRRDGGNLNFQNEFLEEFRAANKTIASEIKELKEDGREALQIERERNAIHEKFLEAFKENNH